MFLAIDIGNSNITIGTFVGDNIKFISRIATDKSKTSDQYAVELKLLFSLYNCDISSLDSAAISSVVPELSEKIRLAVNTVTGLNAEILSAEVNKKMKVLIDNPKQLGSDLLAGCVGAASLYKLPCIVIDLGTASKVSIIDKNGNFKGCAIAPGIGISLDALSEKTSQLPNISLETPSHSIGTNTNDSMRSGTVFGFASMIDGLCDRFEEELDEGVCSVVATGGLAEDLIKSCKRQIVYNKELILYGLKVLFG